MRCILAVIILLIWAGRSHAEDFRIGPRQVVSVVLAPGWQAESKYMPPRGIDLTLTPRGQRTAVCRITILKSVGTERYSKEKVAQALQAMGRRLLTNAVETAVVPCNFEVKNGYGKYATFVDKSLIEKAPVRDQFKIAGVGMVMLSDQFAASVSIFAPGLETEEFMAMIAMVNSLVLRHADN